MAVRLIPIGEVSGDLPAWLERNLAQEIEQDVKTGDGLALPQEAYDPHRGQYLGEALLARLRRISDPEAGRLVGLVAADCYAPGLNFIFGQATRSGRECIVALARLHESFYNRPEDPERFRERVLKEVIHELGHTWGLSHCPDPTCVMHFSNTLQETDQKGRSFCAQCRPRLDWHWPR